MDAISEQSMDVAALADRFGPERTAEGWSFRLWAPRVAEVGLEIGERVRPMEPEGDGWFSLVVGDARAGDLYRFMLADGETLPDPASRRQPDGVNGPSELVDPGTYRWRVADWPGRPWHEAVIYELHVGAFTPEGTLPAAEKRLDHLVELGVTAVELMPLHAFAGEFGWGYDPAALFALHAAYGTPDDLRSFVDAAHERGLMVLLDVVYNHLGAEGKHVTALAPFESERHKSPYGKGPNVDGDGSRHVRDFLIANAIYWLRDYRLDGLRLDAAHEIKDESEPHFLAEFSRTVRAAFPDRHIHLVVENSENAAQWLSRGPGQPVSRYEAQWSDDIHHALHVAATGERYGYYAQHAGTLDDVGRAMAEGFSNQGEEPPNSSEKKGEPSGFLPPTAFVCYVQNHDQVGNRPLGERLHAILPERGVRTLACLSILSPHVPLLFMGEEWAASAPFPYFADLSEDFRDAVRKTRAEQFADWPPSAVPRDPFDHGTFEIAKLDWSEPGRDEHHGRLGFYRHLIALRADEITPYLADVRGHSGAYDVTDGLLTVTWRLGRGRTLRTAVNLSDASVVAPAPLGRMIMACGHIDETEMERWAIRVEVTDQAGAREAGG